MLFELEQVTYSREGKVVLRDVSARLPVGASSVLGPSGSGKSTLLRLLNRLADPGSGRIAYEGRDVSEYDPRTLRHLRSRTAISLVVVTHDIAQARRLAEYVVRIDAGTVIAQGPAAELLT